MFLFKMVEIVNFCFLFIFWDYRDFEFDYKCYFFFVLGLFVIIFRIDCVVGLFFICGMEYYDIFMCFNRKGWL